MSTGAYRRDGVLYLLWAAILPSGAPEETYPYSYVGLLALLLLSKSFFSREISVLLTFLLPIRYGCKALQVFHLPSIIQETVRHSSNMLGVDSARCSAAPLETFYNATSFNSTKRRANPQRQTSTPMRLSGGQSLAPFAPKPRSNVIRAYAD